MQKGEENQLYHNVADWSDSVIVIMLVRTYLLSNLVNNFKNSFGRIGYYHRSINISPLLLIFLIFILSISSSWAKPVTTLSTMIFTFTKWANVFILASRQRAWIRLLKFVAKTSRVLEFASNFIIFGVIVKAVRGTLDFAEKEKSTIMIKLWW